MVVVAIVTTIVPVVAAVVADLAAEAVAGLSLLLFCSFAAVSNTFTTLEPALANAGALFIRACPAKHPAFLLPQAFVTFGVVSTLFGNDYAAWNIETAIP